MVLDNFFGYFYYDFIVVVCYFKFLGLCFGVMLYIIVKDRNLNVLMLEFRIV